MVESGAWSTMYPSEPRRHLRRGASFAGDVPFVIVDAEGCTWRGCTRFGEIDRPRGEAEVVEEEEEDRKQQLNHFCVKER